METWGELFTDAWIRTRIAFRRWKRDNWPPRFARWQIFTATGILSIILTVWLVSNHGKPTEQVAAGDDQVAPETQSEVPTQRVAANSDDPFADFGKPASQTPPMQNNEPVPPPAVDEFADFDVEPVQKVATKPRARKLFSDSLPLPPTEPLVPEPQNEFDVDSELLVDDTSSKTGTNADPFAEPLTGKRVALAPQEEISFDSPVVEVNPIPENQLEVAPQEANPLEANPLEAEMPADVPAEGTEDLFTEPAKPSVEDLPADPAPASQLPTFRFTSPSPGHYSRFGKDEDEEEERHSIRDLRSRQPDLAFQDSPVTEEMEEVTEEPTPVPIAEEPTPSFPDELVETEPVEPEPALEPAAEPEFAPPVVSEPVASEPVVSEPVVSEPVVSEPVPVDAPRRSRFADDDNPFRPSTPTQPSVVEEREPQHLELTFTEPMEEERPDPPLLPEFADEPETVTSEPVITNLLPEPMDEPVPFGEPEPALPEEPIPPRIPRSTGTAPRVTIPTRVPVVVDIPETPLTPSVPDAPATPVVEPSEPVMTQVAPAVMQAKLEFSITGPDTASVGSIVTLQFHVKNTGDAAAENVLITDLLPPALQHRLSSDLEYTVGKLAPGEAKSTHMIVKCVSPGPVMNKAVVVADGDVSAEASVRLLISAQTQRPVVNPAVPPPPGTPRSSPLQVTHRGPERWLQDSTGQFLVTVSNSAGQPLRGVTIKQRVPPGTALVHATPGATVNVDERTVSWTIENFPVGATYILETELMAAAPGAQTSHVEVRLAGQPAGDASWTATADPLVLVP